MNAFVFREAFVLDASGSFEGPLDVRVADGRIAAVGEDVPANGASSFDFSGLWLMPGVFDCHLHPGMSTTDAGETLRTPLTAWALETAANARKTLEGGVTFVRDLAGADAGLRTGFDRGWVPGPHLQISIVLLCRRVGTVTASSPAAPSRPA